MPRLDVLHRRQHLRLQARVLRLQRRQHALDHLALLIGQPARRARAAHHRIAALVGVGDQVALLDVRHRPDDDVLAVVADELGRHRAQRAGEEQVHHQRLGQIVEVMAERDLGGAELVGQPVEHAATQPRAQRARRGARLLGTQHALDDLGDLVRAHHPVLDAAALEMLGDGVGLIAGPALIDVDGDELVAHRRLSREQQERVEQRVRILAARDADHDAVALGDEPVVDHRLADLLRRSAAPAWSRI